MLYPPEPLAKYPHLRSYEAEIMTEYIALYKQEYTGFEYDVLVGEPPPPPPGSPPEMIEDWQYLASLKIDAVGHTEREIHIIELKELARPQDVLQVATYVKLYKQKYKPTKQVRGILVARATRPDTNLLANDFGIEIRLVP